MQPEEVEKMRENESVKGRAPQKFIKRSQVEAMTGLSRSTIYREIAANRFPQQIKLNHEGTRVGWIYEEIVEWIEQRICESRAA